MVTSNDEKVALTNEGVIAMVKVFDKPDPMSWLLTGSSML